MKFGGIEAGGTKMICAIGDENGKIIEKTEIKTNIPTDTLPAMLDFFTDKEISALGIACFGPIDLDINSVSYGYITSTPKEAWQNTNIVGYFKEHLGVPIGFDTDVNGSLLGEVTWGSAKGVSDAIYITIGTGIGAGVISGGRLVHGMLHPEAGHILIRKKDTDFFEGVCPFHKDCFEGLASGPSIEIRWGRPAFELTNSFEVWDLEAEYIAQALMNYSLILSPQRIILGGGVMLHKGLIEIVREKFLNHINGYINTKELNDIENYIVPAGLNGDQGIMGAIKLAMESGRLCA